MIIEYSDEYFMELAMREAKKAYKKKETPIGAIIVKNNKVIARAHNLREKTKKSTAHAEILAIDKACKKLKSWRLIDCDIYVTLEPCPMCAGAIIQSRIKRVIFGAEDKKSGSAGSVIDLFEINDFNHIVKVTRNILKEECSNILKMFFRELRKNK